MTSDEARNDRAVEKHDERRCEECGRWTDAEDMYGDVCAWCLATDAIDEEDDL